MDPRKSGTKKAGGGTLALALLLSATPLLAAEPVRTYQPVGTVQSIAVSSSPIGFPSIPTNAHCAMINVWGASVNYTDDGVTSPTTSATPSTLYWPVGFSGLYCSALKQFKMASQGSSTVNVQFYQELPQ